MELALGRMENAQQVETLTGILLSSGELSYLSR
jgi:hypothetical protein